MAATTGQILHRTLWEKYF